MLLALDTATRHSGLALYGDRGLVAELNWYSLAGQTTELMPRLVQLLRWHGLAPADLTGLAVTLGPGSFTGLRVGLSLAKGLAMAHSLPLLGIPTLDATAYPYLGRREAVCAVVEAGRGRACWAQFGGTEVAAPIDARPAATGDWRGWRTPDRLGDIDSLARQIDRPTWFAGELSPPMRAQLGARIGPLATMAPAGIAPRPTGALALLGWLRLQAGDRDDVASLSPLYLREP